MSPCDARLHRMVSPIWGFVMWNFLYGAWPRGRRGAYCPAAPTATLSVHNTGKKANLKLPVSTLLRNPGNTKPRPLKKISRKFPKSKLPVLRTPISARYFHFIYNAIRSQFRRDVASFSRHYAPCGASRFACFRCLYAAVISRDSCRPSSVCRHALCSAMTHFQHKSP